MPRGKRVKEDENSKKGLKIFVVVLLVIIAIAGGVLGYKYYKDMTNTEEVFVAAEEPEEPEIVEEVKQVKIYKGTDRPIAVMIDNHSDAWPQAGLNDAYMVYEIIVEGGETRLMPVFKGANLEKIGPIRSSRHYFLDYALENDAIYVHFGWSPQAEKDIRNLNVNNINGISESTSNFWRVKDKKAPHNAVTNTSKILEMANEKKYKTTSSEKSVLNYVADEFTLSEKYKTKSETESETDVDTDTTATATTSTDTMVEVKTANKVVIPHSKLHKVIYTYNAETKRYSRTARNKAQTDWDTKEPITTKNIIIEFINNTDLNDGENKGRQNLNTVGTYDGYYITNGEAIKIKCTKSSRSAKTVYKDLSGEEINVNDGNTWVNICPKNAAIAME